MVWISFFSKENFQKCRMKTGMRGHLSYVMNKVTSQTNEAKWEHLNNGFSRKQEIIPQSCAPHLLPAWLQLCGALMSKSRGVMKALISLGTNQSGVYRGNEAQRSRWCWSHCGIWWELDWRWWARPPGRRCRWTGRSGVKLGRVRPWGVKEGGDLKDRIMSEATSNNLETNEPYWLV